MNVYKLFSIIFYMKNSLHQFSFLQRFFGHFWIHKRSTISSVLMHVDAMKSQFKKGEDVCRNH